MSGGTSNPAAAPLTLSTPPALLPTRRARTAARSADGLQSFGEGDIMKLQLDTRTDTVDSSGQTLASTKAMLTVYKNGQEHTGYDNVPVRSLRRVPARCGACPHALCNAQGHCVSSTHSHALPSSLSAEQDGWHFAVGGHGGVAFEIVPPARCAIL